MVAIGRGVPSFTAAIWIYYLLLWLRARHCGTLPAPALISAIRSETSSSHPTKQIPLIIPVPAPSLNTSPHDQDLISNVDLHIGLARSTNYQSQIASTGSQIITRVGNIQYQTQGCVKSSRSRGGSFEECLTGLWICRSHVYDHHLSIPLGWSRAHHKNAWKQDCRYIYTCIIREQALLVHKIK